jgi:hypothetical protein
MTPQACAFPHSVYECPNQISSHQLPLPPAPPISLEGRGTPLCLGPSTLFPPRLTITLKPELTPLLPPPGKSSFFFFPRASSPPSSSSSSSDSSPLFLFSLPLLKPIFALYASVCGRIDASHSTLCRRYNPMVARASVTWWIRRISRRYCTTYRAMCRLLDL